MKFCARIEGQAGYKKRSKKWQQKQHQRIKTFGCFYKCLFSTKERAKVEKKALEGGGRGA